jgi:para-nitrobenzyl esterase
VLERENEIRRGRVVGRMGRTVPVLLIVALCASAMLTFSGCGSGTTATTGLGEVEGKVAPNGVVVFKGIPYAASPVGALRFKPPQPAEPWSGTLKAFDFRDAAAQPKGDLASASGVVKSEDCLNLNVWTPKVDGARRPVMVWIHGGGFTNGSGAEPLYDGSRLARRGDTVVVTINYRLGAFGFLYLGELGGAGYAESGNLGLLDQVAALKWVRDNIAAFGGDPENITVFGESAGSMSICTLMAMPAAKGLFSRAIAESGALNLVHSTEEAAAVTRQLLQYAGVSDIEGLLSLDTDKIVQAESDMIRANPASATVFGPVLDGSVVLEPPLHSLAAGSAAGVELIIGTNLDEMRLWAAEAPAMAIYPLPVVAPFIPKVQAAVGGSADAIAASYKSRRPGATDGDVTMAVLTDVMFRLPAIRVAEARSSRQTKTYMYLFTWSSPAAPKLGSCHAIELPFVFGNVQGTRVEALLGEDPPRKLSDTMQDAWLSFARTGDPNAKGVPAWKAYDLETRATMVFNVESGQKDDPYGEDRRVWDGVPFDGVNP